MNPVKVTMGRAVAAVLTAAALALPVTAHAAVATEAARPMVPMTAQPRVELSTSAVPHRTLLVIKVSGFQPGERVRVEVAGRAVRTVVADSRGRASTHRVIDRRTCGAGCPVTAIGTSSGRASAEFQGLRRR